MTGADRLSLLTAFAVWSALPGHAAPLLYEHGWTAEPLRLDGEIVAVGAMQGTEIHFAVAPGRRHQVLRRDRFTSYLGPLLHRHAFLTTRVVRPNEPGDRFVQRIGFEATWSDDQFNHYMLSAIPFARGQEH